ncbi:EF-P lysine aminoacylase EpmA [Wenxinia marina]|nr:EF-P lysine aminoacylase EpmA [Wenxinia marina]
MGDTPWWDEGRHADRRPLLLARNRIVAAVRDWFAAEGFTEVEPAGLAVSPGNEAHLHAFQTLALDDAGGAAARYLHTSPEFAMKKLLAAGETRIFALSKVWRNRERGPLHASEFTMLEWYRAGAPYEALMEDCAAILSRAAEAAGSGVLRWRSAECDPFAAPERVALHEALAAATGIDLLATIRDDGTTDRDALAAAAGPMAAADDDWSDILSKLLVAHVEPRLGHGRATVLDRYPAAEAALARRVPGDPRLAERFELYACGVELANGFGELTDPAEQRARFEAEMDLKAARYGERYPLDEDFLAALSAMPPASGIALGFDRLVTLATGAPGVEAVMWTPPA